MASQNKLFRIHGRKTVGGETEERIFFFREYSAKALMRRLESRFPGWEFYGEPEPLETIAPPENEPQSIAMPGSGEDEQN